MYKVSRYNHFQPWSNGYHIAYNSRTGAVALMTDDNHALYQRIVNALGNGGDPTFTAEEEDLVKQLLHGQFLYPDHYDELEDLKFGHRMARYEQTTLGLIIAPTMACNMACVYCFENNKQGLMSPETIDSLLAFVRERAPSLRDLTVNWYGGEPLLAMPVIERLSSAFMELAKAHEFDYKASMITNGYLLTPETVSRLVDLKVNSAQVTIDGPSRIHNRKRPLKNGKDSFATIIENVKNAAPKMAISIRVNVDKNTTEDIIVELLDELKQAGVHQRIGVNFGKIEASTTACANISEDCMDSTEFSRAEVLYYRLLFERGFLVGKLPLPSATSCMAQLTSSFLIDHEGRIYRCFNYVGDESKAMGNIKDKIDYSHPRFWDLFRFDPFEDDVCRECNLLPICLGGCPARRFEQRTRREDMCDSWKHNLEPMLEIIARQRQQQMQAAQAQVQAQAAAKEQS